MIVKEGEYVLAVNGVPIDTKSDPWASFQGLGDKTVVLTVNSSPSSTGARQVVVKCLTSETELRFRSWIEERRQIVDKATNGRIGYIYVQSTGVDAQNELVRQFMAQWKKDGLIIDERWNSGGQIPDRFIELLNRPILAYWAVRDGASQQWPPVAHRGPQVMLINGWSGSGGDAFPTYFREAGLGPLIGTRTWGGLIGISGAPALADGGGVTVPDLPDVRSERSVVRRGPRRRPRHRRGRRSRAAGRRERSAAGARDQGSDRARGEVSQSAGAAGVREAGTERKWQPAVTNPRTANRDRASVLYECIIRVAVQPPLARFCGRDDGVRGRSRVRAGVTVRRRVAAERDAARLAGPEVDPA